MAKTLFQILDEMNLEDANNEGTANKTAYVGVCPDMVSAGQKGHKGEVVMGIPGEEILNIFYGKKIPILLLIDKDEYFKRKGT